MGGLLISKFVSAYESSLEQNLLIASFIPLIVYISDAVGTQMESIIIRALSEERDFLFKKFFLKQFIIVLALGLTLGLLGSLGSYVFYGELYTSIGLGISISAAIISSVLTGLLIPYLFWTTHQDPAEASGPIATIIQDSISVFIYFYIMTLLI